MTVDISRRKFLHTGAASALMALSLPAEFEMIGGDFWYDDFNRKTEYGAAVRIFPDFTTPVYEREGAMELACREAVLFLKESATEFLPSGIPFEIRSVSSDYGRGNRFCWYYSPTFDLDDFYPQWELPNPMVSEASETQRIQMFNDGYLLIARQIA